jgi:hypothetical protein
MGAPPLRRTLPPVPAGPVRAGLRKSIKGATDLGIKHIHPHGTETRATRVALLAIVAVSHLIVPGQPGRPAPPAPRFDAAEIARSADVAVISGVVSHAFLLALCACCCGSSPPPRPWTRRLATVYQLLSVLFSAVSWSPPMFHAAIPVIGLAQILHIILLGSPRSAREFFVK